MSGQEQDKSQQFTTISARVPTSLAEAIRVVAEREYRTVSGEVRRLIELRLAEGDDQRTAA